jgi:hypothetical protein
MQGDAGERLSAHGRVTRAELAQRMREFVTTSYFTTMDLMGGGVIAIASVVLLEIVASESFSWLRALLWITSLLAFLVVRSFNRIGALLSSSAFNAGDHAYPVLIGFAEMCSFVFLTDRFANGPFAIGWAASLAGTSLFSCLLIHNRIRQIKPARDYADDAQAFVEAYTAWHKQGRVGTMVWTIASAAAAIAAWLLLRVAEAAMASWITIAVLAVAAFAFATIGLSMSGTVFNRFSQLLK